MVAVGWLGALGLVAAGVLGHGYARHGDDVRGHLLLGLGALLLFVLAHCWVLFYSLAARRVLAGGTGAAAERLAGFSRHTLVPILAVLAAALATFLTGNAVYTGALPWWGHAAPFYATLVLQVWASAAEWRTCVATERLSAGMARPRP